MMLLRSNNRVRTGFVMTVLVSAVLVRFFLSWGAAGEQPATEEPGRMETISLRPELTPQPVKTLPPPAAPVVEEPVVLPTFQASDAAGIHIGGMSTYRPDVEKALSGLWRQEADAAPSVLIVHTHGTESYTAEAGWEYDGADELRTTDAAYSVVRVGRELKQRLEERGVTVLHDETMHDKLSFAGAYTASRAAVEGYLKENPGIDLVIDLHRDAALNPAGSAFAPTVTVGEADYARVMLVVGTDEGGLHHPNWQKNFSCAAQLQALLNRSLPGLCRDMDLRTERFNQDLAPGMLLIEMGAAGNTLREVLQSAEVLADAVAELLGK